MAFVVKIQNGSGDGAGRSRYLLSSPEKVLAVSTNIPSPAIITGDYRLLADDFNRALLARQGDYRTDHFVVSFQHRFNEEEIEQIIGILEEEFQREFGEDRPYLIVVHAEEFKNRTPEELLEERVENKHIPKPSIKGTSFHIVMGRNTEGRGIRLAKKEYLEFKRRIVEKLQPFTNEREREVFRHFLERKRERDYYKRGELYKPEKNEKVWGKKILKDVIGALEGGDVKRAVEILERHGAEIETFEVSPYNKQKLKEPTPYIILPRIGKDGKFAMRLKKADRALWERYRNLMEELKNESERTSKKYRELEQGIRKLEGEIQEDRERIERLGKEERGAPARDREALPRDRGIGRVENEFEELKDRLGSLREQCKELLLWSSRVTDVSSYSPCSPNDYVSVVLTDENQLIVSDPVIAEAKGWDYEMDYEIVEIADLPKVWEQKKLKGQVKVYTFSDDYEKRRKIEEFLRRSVWIEEFYAPYLKKGFKDRREVRPKGIVHVKCWRGRKEIITQEDVEREPSKYRDSDIREVREIAQRRLREIEEARRMEEKIRAELYQEREGRGIRRR